jgi:uncharacterized membrane protein required for colicin V production
LHWLDIVIIAILIATTLIGLKSGLLISLLGLVNSLVSFIIAIFLAKPFAFAMNGMFKLNQVFANMFTGPLSGKYGIPNEILPDGVTLGSILDGSNLNGFLKTILKSIFGGDKTILPPGTNPTEYLSGALGGFVSLVVGFLVAFILVRLIVQFVKKLFKKLKKNDIFNHLDKSLGAVFGFVKGCILIIVAFIFVSVLKYLPFAGDAITNAINNASLAKWCEKATGAILEWLSKNINLQQIISGLFKK